MASDHQIDLFVTNMKLQAARTYLQYNIYASDAGIL